MITKLAALTLLSLALALTGCGERSTDTTPAGTTRTSSSQNSSAQNSSQQTSAPATAATNSTDALSSPASMPMPGMAEMQAHAAIPHFPPGTDLATTVLPASPFQDAIAQDAYLKAREVADRLDKMYCYCHCHEHMGHRSLLTCFQTDHAAECGVCQKEAIQAWLDWKDNLPVSVSQRAADFAYNRGEKPPSLPQ